MLDIDWVTILWEIVNFLIIAVVLYFLVFKPIVKRSEERAQQKAQLIEETIRDREAAASYLRVIEDRLQNLDQEIQQITDELYEKNKVLQVELLDATREEANIILQEAITEVRKKQLIEIKNHQETIVDTVLDISGQTIKKVLPPTVHTQLVEELDKRIWDLGKSDMRQVYIIRERLSGKTASVKVTVASPLTMEQEQKLVKTFSVLADNDVNIDLEVDESLIAGIKVWIGDLIIENSLLFQLESIRESIAESLDQINMSNDE